jgi:hypothetical protein
LTDATVLEDIETEMDAEQIIAEIEWLERASLRCRTPDRRAQATSRLRISGMMKCWRTALCFGFGSGMEFAAEPSPL